MSLKLDEPHIFQSKFNAIQVVATEFDEPQYGCTLWRFKVYVDNEVYNNKLLDYDNKFCGLVANLKEYNLESAEGRYVFIPYGILVLNTNSLELDKYEKQGGSNNDFISNIFVGENLVILEERSISIVDLVEKRIKQKFYDFENRTFEKMWYGNKNVYFLYKDKVSFAIRTLIYNIENKIFTDE